MRIVDQLDAKMFNGLSGVLSKLSMPCGWATRNHVRNEYWHSSENLPLTVDDESWVVIVDWEGFGYTEYKV